MGSIRIGDEMAKAIRKVDSTADYSTATVRDFYGKDSCNPIYIGGAEGNSMDWFFHGAGSCLKFLRCILFCICMKAST